MRITGSNVALAAEHSSVRLEHTRASIETWRERSPAPQPPARPAELPGRCGHGDRCGGREPLDPLSGDYRLNLLALLVERLTGRPVELLDPSELRPEASDHCDGHAQAAPRRAPAARDGELAVRIEVESTRYEHEATAFAARGTVTTADGRTIDFGVEVGMERERYEHASVEILAGAAARKQDPLVLSLDGTPISLTDWKVEFDLDGNGTTESISFAGPGAAFLALDRNGNGLVDDGGELFGARTGDGFAELATLDEDGDGWIDEDDAGFGRLLLWQRDEGGVERLTTLTQAGVGAIYAQAVATPFTVEGSAGQELGELRSTGVYLGEQGGAGVVAHVDLVVE